MRYPLVLDSVVCPSVVELECWSVRVLECWSVGVLECWRSVGVPTIIETMCWIFRIVRTCVLDGAEKQAGTGVEIKSQGKSKLISFPTDLISSLAALKLL